MKTRFVVVAVIKNKKGEILICKKPKDHGVWPGEWAIPGGGIEEKENMREALKREVKEETGLLISHIESSFFNDYITTKFYRNGKPEKIYMISMAFLCKEAGGKLSPSDEFDEFHWASIKELPKFKLNVATQWLFRKLSFL